MDYPITERVRSIAPSVTLAISAKAKKLQSEGQDVVGFGAGEPDFDTPAHIKRACIEAIEAGFTKYTASSGIPELKDAVAAKLKRDQHIDYAASQISVNCGGKHACFNAIATLVDQGAEVIIPAPYWLSYPEMVKFAGGTPIVIPTTDATDFKVTPDALRSAITDRSRLCILNSPSNPTGTVYTPDEIRELTEILVENNILILSDEIYEKLLYDGAEHLSPASISEAARDHTILVHGLAKAYSMTGWRIGFTAAPQPIINAINALQSHSTSNPTSFAQKGAVEALNGPQDHLDQWLKAFDERRRYAFDRLNAMPKISCARAQGAFYLFPNISQLGMSSEAFCDALLEEAKVAAAPGIAFGAEGYFRISYATSMEQIQKGLDRLEAFVTKRAS